jgi:hypothetical protein
MAYDFRNVLKEAEKMRIIIDGEEFDPTSVYDYKVHNLIFKNSNGKVSMEGSFSLPMENLKIPDLVKINKYSLRINQDFVQKNNKNLSDMFNSYRIQISFNHIDKDMKFLKSIKLSQYLIDHKIDMGFVEKKVTFVSQCLIKTLDLKPFMENFEAPVGVFSVEPEESLYNNFKRKIFKNEHGDSQSYEMEFHHEPEEILQEPKVIQRTKYEMKRNFINFKNPNTDFEFTVENKLKFTENGQKFNNPYHFKGDDNQINEKLKKFRKSFFNNSFKVCFNHRGEFLTRGKFNENNFHYSLKVQKIVPNKNLETKGKNTQLIHYWMKNTIYAYQNRLSEKIENLKKINSNMGNSISPIQVTNNLNDSVLFRTNKKSEFYEEKGNKQLDITIEKLTVTDFTSIINDFIEDLNSNRDYVLNLSIPEDESKKKLLKENFEKEISVLKLFKSLFLNCYMNRSNSSLSNKETNINFSNSLRADVMKMRKKRLLDFLVENTESDYQRIMNHNINSSGDAIYQNILTCLVHGRLLKATEIANSQGLINLSMLISQSNSKIKAKLVSESIDAWKRNKIHQVMPKTLVLIYDLIAGRENPSILDYCDWRSLIISESIFTSPLSATLSSIEKKNQIIINGNSNIQRLTLPITSSYNNSIKANNIFYLLTCLYSSFEQLNQSKENKILLQEISNTLTISSSFTDHHIQYIIISILLNTLKESFDFSAFKDGMISQEKKFDTQVVDMGFLKKLHGHLLIKNVEEILISGEVSSWKYAINLIKNSNISDTHKKLLINDIINKNVESASKDKAYFTIFDTTKSAYAFYNLYQFKFREAYENFKQSKNFEKATEIFIFYFLCQSLLNNNSSSNNIKEELFILSRESRNVYYWEKYGVIFQDYINISDYFKESEKSEWKCEESKMNELERLIKKVEVLNMKSDVIYSQILTLCRNYMLTNLRKDFNSKYILNISKPDVRIKLI